MRTHSDDDIFQDNGPSKKDPLQVLEIWLSRARETEIPDPDAMALATADGQGHPDLRVVTLSGIAHGGLIFFTNIDSAKGNQLDENPYAAAGLHWREIGRQIRIRGKTDRIAGDEADIQFARSSVELKIAAIASDQSRPLHDRRTLMRQAAQVATAAIEFEIKRPPQWAGFRLVPASIEFWQKADDRLHDRIHFSRKGEMEPWVRTRLYP